MKLGGLVLINNLINALYCSFIFYIAYSIFYRLIEMKKYIKKSTEDGTYSEAYKISYNKHLKANCISTTIMLGIFSFAQNYTNTIFSMAIGIIIGILLNSIFSKYYPKPEEILSKPK